MTFCKWCNGDGCKSCGFTGRGDTHEPGCDCIDHQDRTLIMSLPNLTAGDRIRLVSMPNDPCPIEPGTTGTVRGVNDLRSLTGRWQIDVDWDTDRSLFLVPGDLYEVIPPKIKAVKIEVPFSEAPHVIDTRVFDGDDCWEKANRWLRSVTPPELGYYKTDVVVTYADGETYSCRFDIGADAPSLGQHIRDFIAALHDGLWDPDPAEVAKYDTFADTYEIGL